MHASNLLKVVLKPRTVSSSSSGQGLNSKKETKSRGTLPSSPDSGLSSVSVNKKTSSASPPVKMSCLCAPTNHAGSFRCRLHRGNQQSWGGRPLAPAPSTAAKSCTAAKSSTTASSNGPSTTPVAVKNGPSAYRAPLPTPCPPMLTFAPAHRSSTTRQSRLSKVSGANDVEPSVAQAHAAAPAAPVHAPRNGSGAVRYLKFAGGSNCANGAVIDGGMIFIKKIQTGGKEAMNEVFGSGTTLSRAGLSL